MASDAAPDDALDVRGLEPGTCRAFQVGPWPILVCNVGGVLHAVENRCSHAAVGLEGGTLHDHEIECPFHGARFDVRSGRATALPARRGLRSYALEDLGGGRVRVRLDAGA